MCPQFPVKRWTSLALGDCLLGQGVLYLAHQSTCSMCPCVMHCIVYMVCMSQWTSGSCTDKYFKWLLKQPKTTKETILFHIYYRPSWNTDWDISTAPVLLHSQTDSSGLNTSKLPILHTKQHIYVLLQQINELWHPKAQTTSPLRSEWLAHSMDFSVWETSNLRWQLMWLY